MTEAAPAGPLSHWVKLPGPRRMLDAARRRIEAGHTGDRVVIARASDPQERKELGRVFGAGWQAAAGPVTLGQLRRAIGDHGLELTPLLEQLGGPLRDLPAERLAIRDERHQARKLAHRTLRQAGLPEPVVELALHGNWLDAPASEAWHRRLDAVVAVLARLQPSDNGSQVQILLPELAAQLFADPHALDVTSEFGRLCARLLAASLAVLEGREPASAVPGALRSANWRASWAAQGVTCDRVSSTVLVLNLPLVGTAPAVGLCASGMASAEPTWLTERSLSGQWQPAPALTGSAVRVCENPSVIEAAADRHSAKSRPLICTFGRPSLAAWRLMRGLSTAGIRLLVSADRDPAGESIIQALMAELSGTSRWLAAAPGCYEEERLDQLLADLQRP